MDYLYSYTYFSESKCLKMQVMFPFFSSKNYFYIYVNSFCQRCFRVCLISCFSRVWIWDCMDCSQPGSLFPWDFPDKNTGVSCHALLQRIFPTQGSNMRLLGLLHCRRILYHWATREAQTCRYMLLMSLLPKCGNWGSKKLEAFLELPI